MADVETIACKRNKWVVSPEIAHPAFTFTSRLSLFAKICEIANEFSIKAGKVPETNMDNFGSELGLKQISLCAGILVVF